MVSGRPTGGSELWIIPASGGKAERLAVTGENSGGWSVARSGSRLAYERSIADANIWRIPGPNSTAKRGPPAKWIASTHWDGEPQFSPDGKKIVFSSGRSGSVEIWICNADGTNAVQLTSLGSPWPEISRHEPRQSVARKQLPCFLAGHQHTVPPSPDGAQSAGWEGGSYIRSPRAFPLVTRQSSIR
jgi:dipeptidyl aminopeptidase/acylaminoacyl peptidase